MLPIIDGCSKNYLTVKTDSGKKEYEKSYSFHLDTGDVAQKAGHTIQDAASQGYRSASRFIRKKYREMKVEKTLKSIRKSLNRTINHDIPVDFRILKRKILHAIHA